MDSTISREEFEQLKAYIDTLQHQVIHLTQFISARFPESSTTSRHNRDTDSSATSIDVVQQQDDANSILSDVSYESICSDNDLAQDEHLLEIQVSNLSVTPTRVVTRRVSIGDSLRKLLNNRRSSTSASSRVDEPTPSTSSGQQAHDTHTDLLLNDDSSVDSEPQVANPAQDIAHNDTQEPQEVGDQLVSTLQTYEQPSSSLASDTSTPAPAKRVRFNLEIDEYNYRIVTAYADASTQTVVSQPRDQLSQASTSDAVQSTSKSGFPEAFMFANNVYAVPHNNTDGKLDIYCHAWGPEQGFICTSFYDRKFTGSQLHQDIRETFDIPDDERLHLAFVQYRMIKPDDKTLWSYGFRNFPAYINRIPMDFEEGRLMKCKLIGRGDSVNGDLAQVHKQSFYRSRRA